MIIKKHKYSFFMGLFAAVALTAHFLFGSTPVYAQTFSCPRDPDYPAAGSTQLATGLRNECPDSAYYIFVGDTSRPSIEYHARSDSGTDVVLATLTMVDPNADPMLWRGTATYDGHPIAIAMSRTGVQSSSTGTQAIRTDNPGTPNEASTGIRIASNEVFTAFAEQQNIELESGTARLDADCKPENGEALNKNNCGIVAYVVTFTKALSGLVGIVVVLMIAVGGIQYAASRDDPTQVAAAKSRIQNAVLALVFYIFALAFLQWLIPGGLF